MRHWRINLIFIFIIFFAAAVCSRLFFLQILQHDFYKALAYGQQKIFSPIKGERGEIFFRNGEVLATNVSRKYVFISPEKIEKEKETAVVLSQALNLDAGQIEEEIKKDNLFVPIKHKLSEEEIGLLEKIELPGIYLGEEARRDYPCGNLASQVVGFVGGDNVGQYGIEEYWNNVLEGEEGYIEEGKKEYSIFSSGKEGGVRKGSDIILTIDSNIQYFSEKLLKEAHEQLNIEGGTIIVINPNSGEVLALANFPGFDPNNYSKEDNFELFLNVGIQKIFEPGSVFKPITMAAALNEGKVTPQTTYTDPGIIKIGGWPIYNYEQRVYPGEITMTGVLEKSINTGAVFAESQIGHNVFLGYIERFGIFEKTGIDLPGEISSSNEEFKKGYEINFATASFGQGIAMTPLQLARAFSVIANGGKLVKPYAVEKIIGNDKIIETQPEISTDEIISAQTSSKLTAMLVSVVENGFAKRARISGYYIAGKTGTAQVPWSALGENRQGYSSKTIQSFVGFAPAFSPKFLALIKLDNPQTGTAEYSAVPIFRELAKYIIDYEQIPPDYET